MSDRFLPFEEGSQTEILTEKYNAPLVMQPGEIDAMVTDIIYDMRACRDNHVATAQEFERTLQYFRHEWRRLWSLYGQSREGWSHYDNLLKNIRLPQGQLQLASNQGSAIHTFGARVMAAALNVPLADQYLSG